MSDISKQLATIFKSSDRTIQQLRDAYYAMQAERNDAISQRDAALAEVERLRAIVDRLPKTADGVHVVPGDRVWHPQMAGNWAFGLTVMANDEAGAEPDMWCACVCTTIGPDNFVASVQDEPVANCYSTPEAAKAAREGDDD